jgi:hypothetical protein
VSEVALVSRLNAINEEKKDPQINEFVENVDKFLHTFGNLSFLPPLWKIYPTKEFKEFMSSATFIYNYISEHLNKAIETMDVEENKNKNTILHQFLNGKHKLELKDIVALMADFIIAGVDTVSLRI